MKLRRELDAQHKEYRVCSSLAVICRSETIEGGEYTRHETERADLQAQIAAFQSAIECAAETVSG